MNTTILILVIIILVVIIVIGTWVLLSKRFDVINYLAGASAILLSVTLCLLLTKPTPKSKEGRVYVQDTDGQRYEVTEIEGSRYLKGPFGTITPYIQPQKE